MTQYGDVNVKLPISQLNRLKSALKNKTEISQRKNEKKRLYRRKFPDDR